MLVSTVKVAQKLNVKIKDIDLIPDFTDFTTLKAKENNVSNLCEFVVDNINKTVKSEKTMTVLY